ncbi:MAG: hypothetical protein RMX96_25735 [Nostoc sp. ChiSLP02]|nr:hypothetical protein [Nostoc sp. DedSLP05]MDZ8103550.1 hypothetical protein [Nostoc sp. DedSLP01]MDZ8188242.1 hypothetical protein [Nostoc sp. ChiSLP02]
MSNFTFQKRPKNNIKEVKLLKLSPYMQDKGFANSDAKGGKRSQRCKKSQELGKS